ncbi:type VI secretion system-associated FHA domain protein TagH [Methylobacterium nodulans]|uniref:FHA domain containing protein n=1 Tax=Methylobacterium nodulans (strain LMG 21967 / CNCM I-2342 / ORS 2060) TaxID=460265 RepID=B8IIB7_METNO|nr:type VI secretion system-associated FHA domain protein TagH [Methylobacterium nodulans]ACL57986.1 FHA domain containing protein [Methylobacterium nodulans ORS 2060]
MILDLTIENETCLPDGGPLSVRVTGRRGIDIGRDAYLDWSLPDPSRTISGKHCEVRFRDGGYWLHDVSSNGTYVNGAETRMAGPHRLRDGDRFEIGRYIIAVRVEGEAGESQAPAPAARAPEPVAPDAYWLPAGEAAAPIPAAELRPARASRPVHAGFDEWIVDVLPPLPAAPEDWAGRPAPARTVAPLGPVPTPRRAVPAEFWERPQEAAPVLPETRLAPSEPAPEPAAPPPRPAATDVAARFAAGLGLPPEVFAERDPGDVAQEAGALLRLTAEHLKDLLAARAETKRVARATQQTTIRARNNNPLKFSPGVEDALRLMFATRPAAGPDPSGYLDARRALDDGFCDLKGHQMKTYAAMQGALRLLLQDLAPDAVEESVAGGGLGGLLGGRRGRLWDHYVLRWQAMTAPYEGGVEDAFMTFFAECYDRGGAA